MKLKIAVSCLPAMIYGKARADESRIETHASALISVKKKVSGGIMFATTSESKNKIISFG
jgi:hypothetical protein